MKGKVPAGNIKLNRAYEAPAPDDGMRSLVDKPLRDFRLRVGKNTRVVEATRNLARVRPFGAGRIRPGPRKSIAWQLGRVGNADYVAAGVALKVGVDADKGELAHFDTGLLAYFAPAGRLHGFADLNKAAGQRVAPGRRLMLAADDKDASDRIEDDAIRRQRGGLR
jgi:hypothetical protein